MSDKQISCAKCGRPLNTQTGGCNWCPMTTPDIEQIKPLTAEARYKGLAELREEHERDRPYVETDTLYCEARAFARCEFLLALLKEKK